VAVEHNDVLDLLQKMNGETVEGNRRRQFLLEIRLRGMSSLNIGRCGNGRSFDISVAQVWSKFAAISLK
jgi:hypothetical protein